nr:MAG TPA: hypothetical protein [Caudoviricetes sp.]
MGCGVWLLFSFFITYKRKLIMIHGIFMVMSLMDFTITIALIIALLKAITDILEIRAKIKLKKAWYNTFNLLYTLKQGKGK